MTYQEYKEQNKVESGWGWSSVARHPLWMYVALGLIHSIKSENKPK